MEGKTLRLRRILNKRTNKSVLIPLDHGVSFGPIEGIEDIEKLVSVLSEASPEAFVLHKGLFRLVSKTVPKNIGLVMHLSASVNFSPNRDTKVLVGTVEEAVRFGADGVSIHVNIGSKTDDRMLSDFGKISEECYLWGMPLLVMIYPKVDTEPFDSNYIDLIKHCVRLCEEIGADMVKVPYMEDMKAFEDIIRFSKIPVLIAGGEKHSDDGKLLDAIGNIIRAGGAGVSIGRNIFQRDNPGGILAKVCNIVHNGKY